MRLNESAHFVAHAQHNIRPESMRSSCNSQAVVILTVFALCRYVSSFSSSTRSSGGIPERIQLRTPFDAEKAMSYARFSNLRLTARSSYGDDSDEESEQLLADRPLSLVPLQDKTVINTGNDHPQGGGRYDDVIDAVGLAGKLKQIPNIPQKRALGQNDVFCNRDLKLSGIRAIGFDMDYTLAQYRQPEFDKLAFDGAKQKLFDALGYPKEVLDFQYDHSVSMCISEMRECDAVHLLRYMLCLQLEQSQLLHSHMRSILIFSL